MGKLIDVARAFFDQDGWPYHDTDMPNVLAVNYQGDNGQWRCLGAANENTGQFVFYSLFPMAVPEERRAAVAEFVLRANFGLISGNFELDVDDGQLRYKTSIDVDGGELTAVLVRNLVFANVILMDHYLPGLMKVLYGDAAPLEALTEVEEGR